MLPSDGEKNPAGPSMGDCDRAGTSASFDGNNGEVHLEDAKRRSAEANLKLEQEKRRTLEYKEKLRRGRDVRRFILGVVSPKGLIALAGLAVAVLLFTQFIKPYFIDGQTGTEYLTSAQLEKVVCVSKLSTAEYVYNGIADVADDNGNIVQHIKYDAKVSAGVDMTQIRFEVDNDKKTVTPVLPVITIDDPEIDHSSFDYLPSNPDMDLKDIISVCKKDARDEITEQGDIYNTATANLKTAVEALTLPLIEDYGYTIVWNDEGDAGQERDSSKDENDYVSAPSGNEEGNGESGGRTDE